jgi:hypothetical protein
MIKMTICSCHKETLVLDAHGELTPEEQTAWKPHQRDMLFALLHKAKDALSTPALSSEEEQLLSTAIQRTLRMEKSEVRSRRSSWWLAPALAACMVLLVAGWFGLRNVGFDTAAIATKRVSDKAVSNNKESLENAGHTAAITSERVPEVQVVSNTEELPENPGSATPDITSERDPEEIIRTNKELLENMDLLQDMESLEQLVNILDKQEQETSLLERETDENYVRALV